MRRLAFFLFLAAAMTGMTTSTWSAEIFIVRLQGEEIMGNDDPRKLAFFANVQSDMTQNGGAVTMEQYNDFASSLANKIPGCASLFNYPPQQSYPCAPGSPGQLPEGWQTSGENFYFRH